jgi:hypothetical protein
MKTTEEAASRQNVTVSLTRETLRKAKVLAAQRETSVSGLLAAQIEAMVGEDEAYRRAEKRARELMDEGFDMGRRPRFNRDELHERR